jgi:dolichol-phosphate mannosyltransferase
MPCYNEADGITDFLNDIHKNLSDCLDYVVVVNDCSTDSTVQLILDYGFMKSKLKLSSNAVNVGHGPSFLNAINQSLELSPDIVITVDGDGQFRAKDIKERLMYFRNSDLDVLECARSGRSDPMFRKLVTYMLRIFIFIQVKNRPMDSNTPLRIYKAGALKNLVQEIPRDSLIPNLRISALTRRIGLEYSQISIESLQRRGITTSGSTWKAKRHWLPSKRFIQFCRSALVELWRFPV